MLANAMYYRVTLQVSPNGKRRGFNVLAGFDPELVFRTAAYKETAALNATTGDIDVIVQKLAKHANAGDVQNLTAGNVQKFIDKNDEALNQAFG